ncbi:MAG: ABC transporter permease [Thermoplasmata archaeon]|nr:ABC transporter permease [Thermoplasmata archaeon]
MNAIRWSLRWRSLKHRSAQTFLAVAAIGAAVALPVVLLSVGGGVYAHELSSIEQAGFSLSVGSTGAHGLSGVHVLANRIDGLGGVAAASPILSIAVDLSTPGGTVVPVLAEGIIPAAFAATQGAAERALLPSSISLGDPSDTAHYSNGSYTGPSSAQVLLSTPLLQTLNVGSGGHVRLSPSSNATAGVQFTVEGAFGLPPGFLGPSPLFVALLPLSQLQSLVGLAHLPSGGLLDSADSIQVAMVPSQAADPVAVQRVAAAIQVLVPYYSVVSLTEQTAELQSAQAVITGFYVGLSSVGLIVGLLFLVIILLRRVEQERQSIGIRRAIGVPAWLVAQGIVAEALALTFAGLLVGLTAGVATVEFLARYGSGGVADIAGLATFDPVTLGLLGAGLVGLALVASVLPIRRALTLSLPEVLR